MGFWQNILGRPSTQVGMWTPNITHIGASEMVDYVGDAISNGTAASLWKSQPHFRTVVAFIARNIAQLGLHVYERVDETDRRRDRTSPLAVALLAPDEDTTLYELVYALVGDLLIYDRAYWFVGASKETASGWMLRRLPPAWVSPQQTTPFTVDSYQVSLDGQNTVSVPTNQVLAFSGYSPSAPHKGSPTVEALRDTLREQVEASRYRRQVWQRGGRVSAVLERPKDAPGWSDKARDAFREDWYAKWTGNGSQAGGTPILEDGMTLNRIDFNAQENQFVEAAKLSMVTVAAAFHVNPTMVGQNDGANYSNVREFRKMLYGDTLGPTIAQIENRINAFLLPRLGMDPQRHYVEFNIAEKLQGNFEEQAAALQTAVGGPWMTRAEARARVNLPTLDGADELIVPMNVTEGGQASPTDSAPKAAAVLAKHQERRDRVIASNPKAALDRDRWDRELAADMAAAFQEES